MNYIGKPISGNLFKHKEDDVEERELLIFLTPRIMKDNLQFSRQLTIVPREQSMLSSRKEAISRSLEEFSKE